MLLLRIILLPITILYALAIFIRNLLYKTGIYPRLEFNIPVICVGNLAAGGTGKTPHIEWLISRLQEEYKIAVLSRGYKRKTTGYILADNNTTPEEIGDEPCQIKQKFPNVAVGVCENRVLGIPNLLSDAPDTQLLLMDDGYQHLSVKAGMYILLTDHNNLFTQDWLLPSGLLREFRSGYKRADIIIITKCPPNLTTEEKQKIKAAIQPLAHQQILFSSLQYSNLLPVFSPVPVSSQTQILCFSGIARAYLFEQHLREHFNVIQTVRYSDHYRYTTKDIADLINRFNAIQSDNKILVCTEKDAVKLREQNNAELLSHYPVYYLPFQIHFDKGEQQLQQSIKTFIHSFDDI